MNKKKNPFARAFEIDLRSLAFFRVLVSLILLGDLLIRSGDIRSHYTDFGSVPRDSVIMNWWEPGYFSLHLFSGESIYIAFLFLVAAVFAIFLLLGYKTKLSTIVSWVLLSSLHTRNQLVLQGGDVLLRCLLFFAMFLPLGHRYSLDEALSRDLPTEFNGDKERKTVLSAGSVGILLQLACVYIFTAFLKSGREWIPDGTAVEFTLSIEQFAKPFGVWLRQFPQVLHFLTYGTWTFELVGPFLLFSPIFFLPLRLLTILGFWGMHVGFFASMELGIFPYISITAMVPFIPSEVWNFLEQRIFKTRKKITIYYDETCGYCKRQVLVLAEFLLLDCALKPAQSEKAVERQFKEKNSWVVVSPSSGNYAFSWDGIIEVCSVSPLFWPLKYVLGAPVIRGFGEWCYRIIATNRSRFGKTVALFLPFRPLGKLASVWGQIACGLFVFLMVLLNVNSVQRWGVVLPPSIAWIGNAVRLDQTWDMFAPYPLREDGWYVVPGLLENGKEVDVYNGEEHPVSWEQPQWVSRTYKNDRWRSHMMMLWNGDFEAHRLYWAQYQCRRWNETRQEGERLSSFQMVFVKREIGVNGFHAAPERVVIWEHNCLSDESN